MPLYVALLTPLSPDGCVDVCALEQHVRDLVEEGMDGFLVAGTTGEGPLLDDEEIALATRTVSRACNGHIVMTQVGRPSTTATVRLLQRALDAGADGVMAVAPYYYELDEAQVEAHYAKVLRSAGDAPCFAYSIPRRTGNDLVPGLVGRLADLGLAGIKDSTRSLERHREYLRIGTDRAPRPFAVYMGSDAYVLVALQGGSAGMVSGIANARPDLLRALRTAVVEGRAAAAAELQSAIDAVRESLQAGGAIAGLKAAVAQRLAARGVSYSAAVRAPLGQPAL
jgi:dihydrodipicolinate synthase/N-acetylneuraminate lyase